MRALLVLLGLGVLVLAGLMMFGFISIDQTRPGMVQAPRFDADVARVQMGMENKTIAVPTVEVEKPTDSQAPD